MAGSFLFAKKERTGKWTASHWLSMSETQKSISSSDGPADTEENVAGQMIQTRCASSSLLGGAFLPCRRRLSASDIFHLDDEERAILCYGPTRLAVILGNLKPNHPIALLSTHTDTRERTSFQDSGIRSFPLLDHWMITSMATDFGC